MKKYYHINDLELSKEQEKKVLEWFAQKLWTILEEAWESDFSGKSYDPLLIEDSKKIAHSYVFNLSKNGSRHHSYIDFKDLEKKLVNYSIDEIRSMRDRERRDVYEDLKIKSPEVLL